MKKFMIYLAVAIDFFKKISPKLFFLFLLALLLRLALMLTTLHPDLWAISFAEHLFAYKGVINIYDYLGELPQTAILVKNYGQNFFTYPPLAYFTLGIFGWLLKPLFNADFFTNLAVNLPTILENRYLAGHLFLTKLPYLFFDMGILVLLRKLFDEPRKKFLATILWLFNPLLFYTAYMIGQFDIIPVFLTLLAVFLVRKKRPFWAAFLLGIGGAYKMFPLLFLPFLAVVQGKNLKRTLFLLLTGFLPYFFSILPFLNSVNFRQTVLLSNQSQKMLFARIPVSGAEYLSLFVVLYLFLLGLAVMKKGEIWRWFLAVLLIFFALTHYHPQWFLWISPFLIIFWAEHRRLAIFPISLFLGWLLLTLFFEPSLSVALFAPVIPSLTLVQPLSVLIGRFYDVFQLKSLIRSVFAAIVLLVMFQLIRIDDSRKNEKA
ncbi:MAG TPA: glycosyltransferase family 87 protein [Clostridia bacterium]|nr:glycosyltransferase family 87 protein [Clostridia bacterium]